MEQLRLSGLDVEDELPPVLLNRLDRAELGDLASSIRENGLLQPLVVRPAPDVPDRFQLVAGERRYRALTMLEWAGRGIAMGNALTEVKAIADEVTSTNVEFGVARILEELV